MARLDSYQGLKMNTNYEDLTGLQRLVYNFIDKERKNHAPDVLHDEIKKAYPTIMPDDMNAAFTAYSRRKVEILT